MRSDQGGNTFQGIAAVGKFMANLLPFRQRQGVRGWWFLINNVEESGLIGQRFRRGSTPLERGGMSLVYLAFPPFLLPRDTPAAHRRMGHQEAQSEAQPAGPAPFNAPGRQLPLRRPPAWPVPDERRPLDVGRGGPVARWLATPLPFRQRQGVRSGEGLRQHVEERGLIGQRFRRGSTPLERGGMSLVSLAFPPFLLPRDAPAAHRRMGHREAQPADPAPFNAPGRQLPLRRPPAWPAPDERRPLDVGLSGLVARWLDIPLPSVQVHSGTFTNRLLNTYHADAMTIGRDIYIKTDKFDLRSASGLALLAHEFTHVSQQLPGSGDATHVSPSRQEQSALENERLVLLHAHAHLGPQNVPLGPHALGAGPASPHRGLWGSPTVPPGPALAPGVPHRMEARSVTPMLAEASRNMAAPEPMLSALPNPVGLSSHDMERIKAEVYQDLMWRIKTEFERGA